MSAEDRVQVGDPVEVLFVRFEGHRPDGRAINYRREWRPATCCSPEDHPGYLGAAFADGRRISVGPGGWRRAR